VHATDPALAEVRAALAACEPLFHRPGSGTARAEADALMAADFVEVGASGRVYPREHVLRVVDERDRAGAVAVLEPTDVACRELAPGLFQLTHHLVQDGRATWRSSLWRWTPGDGLDGWQVLFRRGTAVQARATAVPADGSSRS
jgi:hypothetical protein